MGMDSHIGMDAHSGMDSNIEELIESDPSLVPQGASALLVEPSVLEPEEVAALLVDLHALLAGAESAAVGSPVILSEGPDHEPDSPATGRHFRHSQLSLSAWLFPHPAGAGRSARHQQGHDLRARRSAGKKTRPAPRQAQGSLFGDHLR